MRLNFQSINITATTPATRATGCLKRLTLSCESVLCATCVSFMTRDISLPARARSKNSMLWPMMLAKSLLRMSVRTRKLTHDIW